MDALDFAAKADGEKLVTLFLSPGTPVMAFVWALAALRHPDLKKRLIVSPVVGKPPEAISLPAEWLDRHDASQTGSGSVVDGFDVTFHLFGEQRMPSLLGIRQFASKTCLRQFEGISRIVRGIVPRRQSVRGACRLALGCQIRPR